MFSDGLGVRSSQGALCIFDNTEGRYCESRVFACIISHVFSRKHEWKGHDSVW